MNHPTSTIAKRTECARRIIACAAQAGWTLAYDETRDGTRYLDFARGDYRLQIGLSPSWPGAFLGHWYGYGSAVYPGSFSGVRREFRRATTCADTLDLFLFELARGFAAVARAPFGTWSAASGYGRRMVAGGVS